MTQTQRSIGLQRKGRRSPARMKPIIPTPQTSGTHLRKPSLIQPIPLILTSLILLSLGSSTFAGITLDYEFLPPTKDTIIKHRNGEPVRANLNPPINKESTGSSLKKPDPIRKTIDKTARTETIYLDLYERPIKGIIGGDVLPERAEDQNNRALPQDGHNSLSPSKTGDFRYTNITSVTGRFLGHRVVISRSWIAISQPGCASAPSRCPGGRVYLYLRSFAESKENPPQLHTVFSNPGRHRKAQFGSQLHISEDEKWLIVVSDHAIYESSTKGLVHVYHLSSPMGKSKLSRILEADSGKEQAASNEGQSQMQDKIALEENIVSMKHIAMKPQSANDVAGKSGDKIIDGYSHDENRDINQEVTLQKNVTTVNKLDAEQRKLIQSINIGGYGDVKGLWRKVEGLRSRQYPPDKDFGAAIVFITPEDAEIPILVISAPSHDNGNGAVYIFKAKTAQEPRFPRTPIKLHPSISASKSTIASINPSQIVSPESGRPSSPRFGYAMAGAKKWIAVAIHNPNRVIVYRIQKEWSVSQVLDCSRSEKYGHSFPASSTPNGNEEKLVLSADADGLWLMIGFPSGLGEIHVYKVNPADSSMQLLQIITPPNSVLGGSSVHLGLNADGRSSSSPSSGASVWLHFGCSMSVHGSKMVVSTCPSDTYATLDDKYIQDNSDDEEDDDDDNDGDDNDKEDNDEEEGQDKNAESKMVCQISENNLYRCRNDALGSESETSVVEAKGDGPVLTFKFSPESNQWALGSVIAPAQSKTSGYAAFGQSLAMRDGLFMVSASRLGADPTNEEPVGIVYSFHWTDD